MASVGASLRHQFNVFTAREPREQAKIMESSGTFGARPDRQRFVTYGDKTIITSVLVRIAVDCAYSAEMRHVRLDDQDRYLEDIPSQMNDCLKVESNIDQTGSAFLQDLIYTMCSDPMGSAVIVPVETTVSPYLSNSFDIKDWRVGRVIAHHARFITVEVYNDETGRNEQLTLSKRFAAVVDNPLYSVMNAPNSTLQRVLRKLAQLDAVDEQAASGKLDVIIGLPYNTKHETRRTAAEERRKELQMQLKDSQYGVAYSDVNEKITQLNRPVENNMLNSVDYLVKMLYGQLGLTEGVMNGTATEAEMLNYRNRVTVPLLRAVRDALVRVYLSKTARSQGQSFEFFMDPFAVVPMEKLAEIADKFTRNEILTSNEFRQIVGRKPVTDDPRADQLRNSNMPQGDLGMEGGEDTSDLDGLDAELDDLTAGLAGVGDDLG